MFKIVKEVEWSAAHRLLNYDGICNRLHGHTYKAVFTFTGKLDKNDMVVDFSIIKKKVQGWIDQHWDHSLILNGVDPLINTLLGNEHQIYPMDGNPTAENMAKHLFNIFRHEFLFLAGLVSVEVFEGPKSSAIYEE